MGKREERQRAWWGSGRRSGRGSWLAVRCCSASPKLGVAVSREITGVGSSLGYVGVVLAYMWYHRPCTPPLPTHPPTRLPTHPTTSPSAGAAARSSEVGVASAADPRAGGEGVSPRETLTINAVVVAGALHGDPCQYL